MEQQTRPKGFVEWGAAAGSTYANQELAVTIPGGAGQGAGGGTEVEVHQTVRDPQGNVVIDRMVGHIFRIEDGLIVRFDIRE